MSAEDKREERWIAYHLGELTPAERTAIDAELAEDPEKAGEYKRLVDGIAAWAEEPSPYRPLDLESLNLEQSGALRPGRWASFGRRLKETFGLGGSLAWGLAAAALFVFVLSQTQFTLSIGNTTLYWGEPAPAEPDEELQMQVAALAGQLGDVKETMLANGSRIQSVALDATARDLYLERSLRESESHLVDLQEAESRTRYRDMESMMRLVGYVDPREGAWSRATFRDAGTDPLTVEN